MIRGRRFCSTVESCCRRARFSTMRPRCDWKPEKSVAMAAKKSRIMEGCDAALAGTKRQQISAERDSGEPQVTIAVLLDNAFA
jgi:hypothetical protein